MKDVGKYFDRLIEAYGSTPQALDYGSWENQEQRFKMIAEAIDFAGKTVLDIGCGFADLKPFLERWFGKVYYVGIEASEKAAKVAEKRCLEHLIVRNSWPTPYPFDHKDIVVMNGVLYLHPYEEHLKMIEAAWKVTKEVLIFDCLSVRSEKKRIHEFYRKPHAILSDCQIYTPYVTLRHEKGKHFFMVYLYREKQ